MGQCDVTATWCKEEDLPSSLLDEYNRKLQPHRELQSLNFSGQAAVVATHPESQTKKLRTDRLHTATEGYLLGFRRS